MARNDREVAERESFSACHGADIRNMTVGDKFELCQAGYPDRKLVYNDRIRLAYSSLGTQSGIIITFHNFDFSTFLVARRMQNLRAVEGVIYKATCHNAVEFEQCHAKFYLRPKMNSHQGLDIPDHLLVVRAADPRAWRFNNNNKNKIEDLTHALMEAHYLH